ncbi:MAG: primosomal protein N' [Wujia sp.]
MSQKYADIIIDISHEAIDRTFQYMIPDDMIDVIEVGMQVAVPFGQANRIRTGYVIGITEKPSFDVSKMKCISSIPDKSLQLEGKLIRLAAWMRETYGSTMIHALKTVMPVREKIRATVQKVQEPVYSLDKPPVQHLSARQQELVTAFCADYNAGERPVYLLRGVTGSGKTEVYIGCIREVISRGRQAIVLIPEIGLTYQNVARFRQHFGERVAIINSRQSKGEKYREFMRAKNREVDVIVGPRSALFTPCADLGLIVIDEEHDPAYKSDQTPRYHARETAIERARLENASVILGSATPTVESYARAKLGEYRLWELPDRPDGMELSEVSVVDLREEFHMGNRSIVSKALYDMIEDRLQKKEQIMLFINRRGYNSFVSCRDCGEVIKCPKCDVALSLHNNGFMMCHYCGYIERESKQCPKCSSRMIGGFGTGTEKVEAEIHRLFPDARTLRMDRDTTTKKGAHGDILNRFLKHEADILIGTQMIVKGHDFANVTLVGIMLADMSLFANDFRAGERTFDLLTQAAGRAGRGDRPGHVLIQTYQPEHYAIVAAAKQDYEGFFETEMSYRRLLRYPPVYNMMVLLVTSPVSEDAVAASEELAGQLKKKAASCEHVRVIGPGEASIGKINEVYRRVIYIKAMGMPALADMRDIADAYSRENVSVAVDVNPMMAY